MSSQKQSKPHGQSQKSRAEERSTMDAGQMEDPARLNELTGSLATSVEGASVEGHAAQLGNLRLQRLQRQRMVKQIGQVMGNQYLQRVMRQVEQTQGPAEASPPQRQPRDPGRTGPVSITTRALPGGRIGRLYRIPFSQVISRADAEGGEGQEEQTEQEQPLTIGEITSGEEIEPSDDNTIRSTLTHTPTVNQAGAGPSGFGVTRSALRFANVVITPSIGTLVGSGNYTVTGDLEHDITWQVRSSTGPRGQVDIQGDEDSDIQAGNYQLVAKDLIPDMGDLGGRPPRDHYWAQDLTIQHELVHADQRENSFGPDSTRAMQNWLNGQTASSADEVRNTLLPQALSEGIRVFNTFARAPSTEEEAYGDGAPSYLARANAVKAKGDAGDYGQISAEVTVQSRGGSEYEVVQGDTLWAIAERTYGHGRYWRQIYQANRDRVREGGNLIFPGTRLDLPTINIDREVWVALSMGTTTYVTNAVVVPGGGSHEFFVPAKDLFSDTTNNAGDVTVQVYDADSNQLLTLTWALPGRANSSGGGVEVSTGIVP